MLNQKLQQKLLQKLSPQQIQMIKLLEVPTIQIEQRIKKELEENPALEEGPEDENIPEGETEDDEPGDAENTDDEEFTLDDYINDEDEIPEYKLQANNFSKDDDKNTEIPFSAGSSFHEHLESQLALRDLNEKQKLLGEYIIGNIDEDGYLRRELVNIVDDLAFLQNVTTNEEELAEVLKIIQDLEPAGVGARTLKECLLLQLERKETSLPEVKLSQSIIENYFDEFSKRHYKKIVELMAISEDDLK
ncbi:MAG TPA: RNA polymerase sigma-54 factor, partial [Bacteroidales bacterium]|nr:RNA polymerase sigma-54 factor [Bacteroidales bacterium]